MILEKARARSERLVQRLAVGGWGTRPAYSARLAVRDRRSWMYAEFDALVSREAGGLGELGLPAC